MIALYDSYLSLARQMVYPVSEIRKVTNKNLKICISSADFFVDVGKKRDLFAYIRKKLYLCSEFLTKNHYELHANGTIRCAKSC